MSHVHFDWLRRRFDVSFWRRRNNFETRSLQFQIMGILINDNGEFKIEVIKEIAEDIASSLEQGSRLSQRTAEELAQKAHEHFSQKWDEFHELIGEIDSLQQGSYGAEVGHEGMNEIFSLLLCEAISREKLLEEIQVALK